MTERQSGESVFSDSELKNKAKSFNPKDVVLKTTFDISPLRETSAYAQRRDQLVSDDSIDKVKSEVDFILANRNVVSRKEIYKLRGMLGVYKPDDNLKNEEKYGRTEIFGKKVQVFFQSFKKDYLPRTSKKIASLVAAGLASLQLGIATPAIAEKKGDIKADKKTEVKGEMESQSAKVGDVDIVDVDKTTPDPTPDTSTLPSPTPEVKAEATAAIKDPNQKVSIEKIKWIFEDYKRTLFAPFRKEMVDYGFEDENWIDFGSKVLNCYDNSGDNLGDLVVGDGWQEHVKREDIFIFLEKAMDKMAVPSKDKSDFRVFRDDETNLEIICTKEGKPRMLTVESTKKITKSIISSFDLHKKNGFKNIQDAIYENGLVVYYCSDRGRGVGSFIVNEAGLICAELTEQNTKEIEDKKLMYINAFSLYSESLDIFVCQMRAGLSIDTFGDYVGDVEVIKSKQGSLLYGELFVLNKLDFYRSNNLDLSAMANNFSNDFSIPIDDPRIIKQMAMVSVLSVPPEGVNWDNIDEIKKAKENTLVA